MKVNSKSEAVDNPSGDKTHSGRRRQGVRDRSAEDIKRLAHPRAGGHRLAAIDAPLKNGGEDDAGHGVILAADRRAIGHRPGGGPSRDRNYFTRRGPPARAVSLS